MSFGWAIATSKLLLLLLAAATSALPEPGKWKLSLNSTNEYNGVSKNVYKVGGGNRGGGGELVGSLFP